VSALLVFLTGACGSKDEGTGSQAAPNPATGSPITVGWVNTDNGAFAFPETTTMAESAIEYVNGHGGINNHPLKLSKCSTDGTPASSVQCANQFVAEKVAAVLVGYDVTLDAAADIYQNAGLRLVSALVTPKNAGNPEDTTFGPPPALVFSGAPAIFKLIGADRIQFVYSDTGPAVEQIFESVADSVNGAGMSASLSPVAAANPDVTAAINAAKAKDADTLYFLFAENDCTNAIRTARQLGWDGKIFAGTCSKFIEDLGEQAAGVYTQGNAFSFRSRESAIEVIPGLKPEFNVYESAAKANAPEYLTSNNALFGFSVVMTFAEAARTITGTLDQASIGKALAAYHGRQFLGTEQDCSTKPVPGAACGSELVILEAQSDGTQRVVGGKPINLVEAG
jgi:branched-chain amino acid transport system substrate-binding protein